MLVSLAGTSCGYVLSALALDYRWLLAARGMQGFFSSSLSVANAYIADIFPQSERPRLMANLRGLGSATYIICPTIGSLLSLVSLRAPYLAGAGTSALAFVVAFVWMPSSADLLAHSTTADQLLPAVEASRPERPALSPAAVDAPGPVKSSQVEASTVTGGLRWRIIGLLGLLNVLMSFAVAAAMFVVALYLNARLAWNQVEVAVIMTSSSILGLGFQFGGFDWLQRRLGLLRVGALAGLLLSLAYSLLTLVVTPSGMAIALVGLVTLLQGTGIAVSMAVPAPLLAQYATPTTMGRVMAFATTTGTVGRVIGPVSLSILFALDPALPLRLTSGLCLLGAAGYLTVFLAEAREARAEEACAAAGDQGGSNDGDARATVTPYRAI